MTWLVFSRCWADHLDPVVLVLCGFKLQALVMVHSLFFTWLSQFPDHDLISLFQVLGWPQWWSRSCSPHTTWSSSRGLSSTCSARSSRSCPGLAVTMTGAPLSVGSTLLMLHIWNLTTRAHPLRTFTCEHCWNVGSIKPFVYITVDQIHFFSLVSLLLWWSNISGWSVWCPSP